MVPHDLRNLLMQFTYRLFPLRVLLLLSAVLLLTLNVFSFYGIYTHRFYFLKFDNYIFPILTILHYLYLYAIWEKRKEHQIPDIKMRNIEYTLYFIYMIYIFKFAESIYRLTTYSDFEIDLIPETFFPIGLILAFLYLFLLIITILTFNYRRKVIGAYDFEDLSDTIDDWKK